MFDAGVIVALGSDFNPNAYCCSMVTIRLNLFKQRLLVEIYMIHLISFYLVCLLAYGDALGLCADEDVYAWSFGCKHYKCRLRSQPFTYTWVAWNGKQGDLVIINAPRLDHTHTIPKDLWRQLLNSLGSQVFFNKVWKKIIYIYTHWAL